MSTGVGEFSEKNADCRRDLLVALRPRDGSATDIPVAAIQDCGLSPEMAANANQRRRSPVRFSSRQYSNVCAHPRAALGPSARALPPGTPILLKDEGWPASQSGLGCTPILLRAMKARTALLWSCIC